MKEEEVDVCSFHYRQPQRSTWVRVFGNKEGEFEEGVIERVGEVTERAKPSLLGQHHHPPHRTFRKEE